MIRVSAFPVGAVIAIADVTHYESAGAHPDSQLVVDETCGLAIIENRPFRLGPSRLAH
jgi:hypothetical protein